MDGLVGGVMPIASALLLSLCAFALLHAYNQFTAEIEEHEVNGTPATRAKLWRGLSGSGCVFCCMAAALVGVA